MDGAEFDLLSARIDVSTSFSDCYEFFGHGGAHFIFFGHGGADFISHGIDGVYLVFYFGSASASTSPRSQRRTSFPSRSPS